MRILFVCLGNICRSPIAEGVMRYLADQENLDWVIASAGTESFHIGQAPHKFSQYVCKENSIDISKQRAQQFTKDHLKQFDRIYAMSVDVLIEIEKIVGIKCQENNVQLFLDEIYPNENRSVKDPWYGDLYAYYEVYNEIKETCDIILSRYK